SYQARRAFQLEATVPERTLFVFSDLSFWSKTCQTPYQIKFGRGFSAGISNHIQADTAGLSADFGRDEICPRIVPELPLMAATWLVRAAFGVRQV
ncbi:MAG: hypothetical protein NXI02_14255, partial [Rhodobacteraceae bacterium]|nr:hypothetical protein [Paracoccaceae bacterium]